MAKALKEIGITHISLVKSGANQKEIIYKSSKDEPVFSKEITIKKSDEEKGIVYGIVYAPDTLDTDGEFASAVEIEKAAYLFMKNQNTTNVDKDHSFNNEKAYVCESWIVKANDSVFPSEPVGSWAVAIKLEDEELKKSVKAGEIAGISMAGTALKEEVKKEARYSLKEWAEFFGITKTNKGESVEKQAVEKMVKEALEPINKEVQTLKSENEALKKENEVVKEELKKSRQNNTPATQEQTTTYGGIL